MSIPCQSYRTPRLFFFRLAVVALAFTVNYIAVIAVLIALVFIIH